MASTLSAIACPNCACCATEDDYYKTGEKYIICYRCGYLYVKSIVYNKDQGDVKFKEKITEGHGMWQLVKQKDQGEGKRIILNTRLSDKTIAEYKEELLNTIGVDLMKSYFVLFEDGVFTTIAGNPPKDFYLSFEEYKAKAQANNELLEIIVPV